MAYYRSYCRSMLRGEELPAIPFPPTRTVIRGAWGEQVLTVPVTGGRRRLRSTPFDKLTLSEHGSWRHAHWQAITSAYGSLPYFPYYSDAFAEIYARPAGSLSALCFALHSAFMKLSGIQEAIEWLKRNPRELPSPPDLEAFPPHISAIELLFARGPESIFYLL